VAVVVANYDSAGGLAKGAALRFQDSPEPPQWQRSVFNGLAQIIVQSSKVPGQLKLTARSAGLQPAAAAIKTQTCPLRPCVP
jgi:beta-galactosidase